MYSNGNQTRTASAQQAHNVYTTLVLGHIYVTLYINVYTTFLQRL